MQVKNGHVNSGLIRDLAGTLERENAAIGVFVTLEEPSKDMQREAASADFYVSELWQKSSPKIQILTIEELLSGKISICRPRTTPSKRPNVSKNRKASRVSCLIDHRKSP